jgi:hypothetical protein
MLLTLAVGRFKIEPNRFDTPKSVNMDAGEPVHGANSLQDRTLPDPSPSANLVGEWKDKMVTIIYNRLVGILLLSLLASQEISRAC